MVLLSPAVTALQTLLEVCWTTCHCIQHSKNSICVLVRPKQSQGRYSTRVRLGNEELSFVEEFHYLGHIMTADCVVMIRILKNNSGGKMQLAICWYCYPTVTTSPNSTVTAIVNSGAFHQSPQMDKCTGDICYKCRNNYRYNYLSICQCVMNGFVIN